MPMRTFMNGSPYTGGAEDFLQRRYPDFRRFWRLDVLGFVGGRIKSEMGISNKRKF